MYHGPVTSTRATGRRFGLGGLLLSLVLLAPACSSDRPKDIVVEGQVITVVNRSRDTWENVEIWLNDHYRVTRSRMQPGERFGVPLNAFVAAFGQRFAPGRQVVQGIEVTASTGSGQAVRLVWGEGRRR